MLGVRSRILVAACALLSACAARAPSRQTAADLARADQLATIGCYSCLQVALQIVERELQARRAPAGLARRAFETAILLTLREKELGISWDTSLAKARAHATKLAGETAEPSAALVLELAELAPADISGFDPDSSPLPSDRRVRLPKQRPLVDNSTAPTLVTTYLTLAIDCDDGAARQKISPDQVLARHARSPLIRYRLGACGFNARETLGALRKEDPRWIEAAFFEGRAAMISRPINLRAAIDLFTEAHAGLPRSGAILLALAHAQRAYSDLEPALASYDSVIAMVPTIREALLGRVMTLTYLKRPLEAIETATRMIELGRWLLADAYYWRAWNRYSLRALEDAWSDAEQAVKISANTNVYTLAGVIAYDRKQLDTTKGMFLNAVRMDLGNCDAHSYLGLVHVAQDAWPLATPSFSTAMACFVQAAARARRELAEIEASDQDPVFRARLAADRRKAVEDSDRKAAEAGFNAAQGYLRAGKRNEARGHLQIALDYPSLHEKAEALRKVVEGK